MEHHIEETVKTSSEDYGPNDVELHGSSQVPYADLEEISLNLLKDCDKTEESRLLDACMRDGVFYLNLQSQEGKDEPLWRSSRDIYHVLEALFSLPEDEKMKYDIDHHGEMKLNGYKPLGRNKGGLSGQRDGFESYAIAKDLTLSLASPAAREPHPGVVTSRLPLLRAFTEEATAATTAILAALSRALGLVPTAATAAAADRRPLVLLEAHHRPGVPSPSMLRLLRYAPLPAGVGAGGAPQVAHTDLGSLTVLFAGAPGLQRKNPRRGSGCGCQRSGGGGGGGGGRGGEEGRGGGGGGGEADAEAAAVVAGDDDDDGGGGGGGGDGSVGDDEGWEYVAPREGCAVVNVGDGLVALTGGLLHSCLHRVMPLPGRGMGARRSFAWMERAEAATVMRPLEGGVIPQGAAQPSSSPGDPAFYTSGEWLRRKFVMLRK